MKPPSPRPWQISPTIHLQHLSDLAHAFYLNEGLCLHMATHVNPDPAIALTSSDSKYTLNKWKTVPNRYLQVKMWCDHFSYLEVFKNETYCKTASIICHISFESMAEKIRAYGATINRPLSCMFAVLFLIVWWTRMARVGACRIAVTPRTPVVSHYIIS